MRNWCFPRNVKNNIRRFLPGFTDGFILSKIAMSMGLYFRIGLRRMKTNIAMAAAKMTSESNISAKINKVISQTFMDNEIN
jgi:hypothetical protein